jgi:two-component system cell cycle sensor histidine kinase/response regulator CckA
LISAFVPDNALPSSRALDPSESDSLPEGRADGAWLSRSAQLVGRSIMVGLLLVLGRDAVLGRPPVPLATAVAFAGIAVAGGALWLSRSGRPRMAARILAHALPVLAAGLAFAAGRGFRDPAILMMPASLILSGVLLSRRALVVTTTLALAGTTGLLYAEARWLVVPRGGADALSADVMDSTIILVITSICVGIVTGRLRQSVERLRRQETALRASEQRHRSLVDLAADGIVVWSPIEGISESNRQVSELTGYSPAELRGRPLEALFLPAELVRDPVRHDAVARGETVVLERLIRRKDGGVRPVEMSTKRMPDGTNQSILRDASERRRAEAERESLEARLRQAQKMEAVGRLAGGVAHDFNNRLTAITGSLTMALRSVPEDSPARRWLAEVDRSAWRAAGLTRHLLAFSRQQVIEPRVFDLRAVVEGAASLVSRTIGEDVRLHLRVPDEPCPVLVDQGQMEQVILNLATNARDAMPGGGSLTLEVGWSAEAPLPTGERPPHRFAVLRVSDTGHGMAGSVRARIFEPFFTTKPAGTGTGLGLAMVYGAVEQNGGRIEVDSAPGRGTTFRICLPEATPGEPAVVEPFPDDVPRGTETILCVEDEATVREVTAEQLRSLGYRVLACASGVEALKVAAEHDGPIHLLLTDVVMPDLNGRDLAASLLAVRKDIRVLYTTGYGEDVVARHGIVEDGLLLVEKPFSLAALAQQVRRALGGPKRPSDCSAADRR